MHEDKSYQEFPVVILCGGMGTRLREETAFKPKPLVEIGGMPILWHIMKWYYKFNIRKFILCLGYKGEMIRDYFLNYQWRRYDFKLRLRSGEKDIYDQDNQNHDEIEDWEIDFIDTGQDTNTGGRVAYVKPFIHSDTFFMTYGDGVSDVDIEDTYRFHREKGKVATLTGLHPLSKYGQIRVDEQSIVKSFTEKPRLADLINGGFFVFEKSIFDYITDDYILEKEPFESLAKDRQIALYQHHGFWHAMDTYKDAIILNEIWNRPNCPWRYW